jgi:hypothetical protein
MKMEQCSETSAYKLQTPGNYPEESIQQNTDYITFYSDVEEKTNLLEYNTLLSDVWIADMERLAAFIFRV